MKVSQTKSLADFCNKTEKYIEEVSVLLGASGWSPEFIQKELGLLDSIRALKGTMTRIDTIGKILAGDKWRQDSANATVVDISTAPKRIRRLEIDMTDAPALPMRTEDAE